ncbi:MAG: hypothetical protein V4607_01865 [Pseudomonadota bacterium]
MAAARVFTGEFQDHAQILPAGEGMRSMNKFLDFFICLLLITSSAAVAGVFIILWVRFDFDYAWNRFESLIKEAFDS